MLTKIPIKLFLRKVICVLASFMILATSLILILPTQTSANVGQPARNAVESFFNAGLEKDFDSIVGYASL